MKGIDNLLLALKNMGINELPVEILKIKDRINDEDIANDILHSILKKTITDYTTLMQYISNKFDISEDTAKAKIAEVVGESSSSAEVIDVDSIKLAAEKSKKKENPDNVNPDGEKKDDAESGEKDKKENEAEKDEDKSKDEEKDEKKTLTDSEVTGHTASMWKYNPIPENEPEPYLEYLSKTLEIDGASIIGARVRGKKHKHDGTNCDDWFEADNVRNWSVIAVSDGAGSKKFSRIGAMESCKSAVEFMKQKMQGFVEDEAFVETIKKPLDDKNFMESCGVLANAMQEAVVYANDAVEKAFNTRKSQYNYLKVVERDLEFKDFSGTLLLCMIIPLDIDGKREHLIISCQIGDGMIAAVSADMPMENALKLLGEADGGDFSGETDFLTSEKMKNKDTLVRKTRIARRKISHIMIMTDGVADDYYPYSPNMLRLFCDLALNNVIEIKTDKKADEAVIKKLPSPASYPWVNNNEEMVAVQYADKIMEEGKLNIEDLWTSKEILKEASLESHKLKLDDNPEKCLLKWLDNYVQRGSFDDRTLVLYEAAE